MTVAIKDYTGMIIGRLTVLERLPPPPGKRGAFYRCKCSCGNECVKSSAQLSSAYYWGMRARCGKCRDKKPNTFNGKPKKKAKK